MADVAMGFLFVQVAPVGQSTWHMTAADRLTLGLLMAASCLLYAAGVVLNDVFDVELDRRERPERPTPLGPRIAARGPACLGWLLLAGGVALAWLAPLPAWQFRPGMIGTLLAVSIVLYDRGLKRTPLGPLAHGRCRMLNVLLGMSVLAGPFATGTLPGRRRHRRLHCGRHLAGPQGERPQSGRRQLARRRW